MLVPGINNSVLEVGHILLRLIIKLSEPQRKDYYLQNIIITVVTLVSMHYTKCVKLTKLCHFLKSHLMKFCISILCL